MFSLWCGDSYLHQLGARFFGIKSGLEKDEAGEFSPILVDEYKEPILEVEDHILAQTYHWSLSEIDSLPTPDRRKYLHMIYHDLKCKADALEEAKQH